MTSPLTLKFTPYDDFVPVMVVQVVGELDSNTYQAFQTQMMEEVESGTRHFLLDLSRLTYMSSAGLRVLFALAQVAASRFGQAAPSGAFKSPYLKLLDPIPAVRSAMETIGLHMSIEIYEHQDVALASFSHIVDEQDDAEDTHTNRAFSLSEEQKQAFRSDGPELDRERMELLRGKRILFVTGSYEGKRYMYEDARELGVNMVVLDGPGHWTQSAVQEGLFERFIEVDLLPAETVPERAFAAIKASGLHFDGVATFEDSAGPLAALLAKALGLPGHPLLAIGFSKNKVFTREVCVEAGIPSPRFFRIKSTADLDAAAAHVGFPAVLKPISGFSSISTYLVKDEETLRMRHAQTMSEVQGHLKKDHVHSDDDSEMIWSRGLDMTLEEFLDGEEFDVDVLLSEGVRTYANVGRDVMQPTHLKEAGSQMPPLCTEDEQKEMIAFAGQVLQALGFTDGAFHVEVKYTSNGPRLIEVNARIGGGPISYFHLHVWGVDMVAQYLLTCLGVPIRPHRAAKPLTYLLTSDLPSPCTGMVTNVDFLKPFEMHPQVVHCHTKVEVGQHIIGSDRGIPDWLGEIMVHADSVQAAVQLMDEFLAQINWPIATD